jgi:integrase
MRITWGLITSCPSFHVCQPAHQVPDRSSWRASLSTPARKETRILSADKGRHLLKTTKDERLAAALVLLLLLGLRRSEVLGLRWDDVDLDRRVLHVRQGLHWLEGRLQFLPPKTRRSRRTVPLPSLCADALREHRARQDRERAESLHPWPDLGLGFVTTIGTPIDPNNFSRTFARWCRKPEVPAVRLHDLRHACVSMLLTLGVNPRVVMEIVGHAALEMTMNVYGHIALDDQRAALDRLNGLLDEEALLSNSAVTRDSRGCIRGEGAGQRGWPGAGSNRRPSDFQSDARTN